MPSAQLSKQPSQNKSKAAKAKQVKEVVATCPYCGCGCQLIFQVDQESKKVTKVLPHSEDVISRGRPCLKGLTVNEMMSTKRLTSPMIRNSQGDLEECSWEDAFDRIKNEIFRIYTKDTGKNPKAQSGNYFMPRLRDEVYFLGSGETTNESNYLLSKLARNLFVTNNVDSCARLCHAATAVGFDRIFGMKAIPEYKQDDLKDAELFLFVGTDPMEDYPVLFHRVLEAKKNGAQIITIDVGANSTTQQSDEFLRISPKGILPVLARLSLRLVEGRDISKEAKNFPGFNEFLKSLEVIKDENPISTLGISRDDMERLYNMVNDSNKTVIGFGMGLTQHVGGVENVMAITGLSLLIDGILFPNRGKINVQGAGDVGVEPAWKPLEGFVEYDWSDDFLTHDGKVSTRALYEDEVELVWVMGTNPSHSMPHLNLLDKSFKDKFIIYQHHHPGRTMEFADVVLPSRVVSEVDGSVTNGERRVRGFFGGVEETGAGRKNTIGIAAPQKALSNFEILNKFGQYMQVVGFPFANEQDAFEEIVQVIRGYQKLEISEVAGKDGDFANKQPPKKEFFPVKYDNDHFQGDGQYPFVFTTARSKYHFCTGEATRNSATLIKLDAVPFVRMSHSDAKLLGLLDGGRVRIYSKVGEIEANIKVDASIEKRVLIAPYHFEKLLVNKLTPLELDPVSKTPGYKYISVNVELIKF